MAPEKKIKNRKKLQKMIDTYFELLGGRPPTVAGLALACGLKSKRSLYNYRKDEKFSDIIDEAILRIEEYTEECLFNKETARGAEFSLKYNFRWGENAVDTGNEQNVIILADVKEEYSDEQ